MTAPGFANNEIENVIIRLQTQILSSISPKVAQPPSFDNFWKESLAKFQDENTWLAYRSSKGDLKAHVGYANIYSPFFGQVTERCLFQFDIDDPDAFRWMEQRVRDHIPDAHDLSSLTLPLAYRGLWPAFREKGFGIGEVHFGGFARTAHERLRKHSQEKPSVSLVDLGLELSPLTDPEDIPGISELRLEVFTDEPDRCWFYRNPGVKEKFEAFTRDRITNGRQWKITASEKIVGFFGYGLIDRNYFGREVAMDFAVHRSLHGLGIGRLAYEIMLDQMLVDDVTYFSGSTANPAVIHLAQIMQRPIDRFALRSLKRCPDQSMFKSVLQALET